MPNDFIGLGLCFYAFNDGAGRNGVGNRRFAAFSMVYYSAKNAQNITQYYTSSTILSIKDVILAH
jgi:hypothetical protein